MEIRRILIGELHARLPHPIRLGAAEILTRDFVALRLETDQGIAGEALGYTRGTPLLGCLEMLAPQLVGRDPLMRSELLASIGERNVPGRSAFTRAVSLIDIACWDILARNAGLPLYRLLGGLRASAPATAVAGYYMDRRPLDDLADEVARRIDEGFPRVKVMLKGDDAAFDLAYVDQVSRRAPGQVAADAHWSWSTLTEATRFCRRLDPASLAFLEDPFAAADWPLVSALRQATSVPIAMGEDVVGARAMHDLAFGVDLLRVDATTCGGLTGALQAIQFAAAAGVNVLPHVFAPLHVHLACAFSNIEGVEVIPADTGADPIEEVLLHVPQTKDGVMRPSDEPGVGLAINWDAIERGSGATALIER